MRRSGRRKQKTRRSAGSAIRLPNFTPQLKQQPDELSLLLDLPPEIRNLIYEKVLEETEVFLPRDTKKCLATASALTRVNQQVRHESLGSVWVGADITTTVTDFDFRHIVTFINRLAEDELKVSSNIGVQSIRRITIQLNITPRCRYDPGYLWRWFARMEHPTKKGTNIRYDYEVAKKCNFLNSRLYEWLQPGPAQYPNRRYWNETLGRMKEGKSKAALREIVDALYARAVRGTR